MAANNKARDRVNSKNKSQLKSAKKPLIDPRYKSFVNLVIFLALALLFFIINNTRNEPESGPYPPDFNKAQAEEILKK